ncbi:hypothetical protein PQO01_15275 [Lentisphaera marina]|uniref:hypothetical protein n=1 Tax=Lentisphaera marina TaxID=1111041 RepID=UPI0023667895|nr:hypothetical protein [Lentisphaera marina]MDD7986311.1 hypothetical protein [Lentisphaera marina]
MKNLSTLNFYIRNIKILSFLVFLSGLFLSALEIADYLSKLKVSSYAPSHSLGNESEKLHQELKRVKTNLSGLMLQFGEQEVAYRKEQLYKSYRDEAELEDLIGELGLIDADLIEYKSLLISTLNKDIDEMIKRINGVIQAYQQEGLIEVKEEKAAVKDFEPVYGPKALENLPLMQNKLDETYTYMEELGAQMDKKENRDLVDSYLSKLMVLKNFVGSHKKKLDVKEDEIKIKVLQVRDDLTQIRNDLRLNLTSHWAIEEQIEKVREIASLELNNAEQSQKVLKNLSFRYLKGVLLLLVFSFMLPFAMMLGADYMRLKIGDSSNGA